MSATFRLWVFCFVSGVCFLVFLLFFFFVWLGFLRTHESELKLLIANAVEELSFLDTSAAVTATISSHAVTSSTSTGNQYISTDLSVNTAHHHYSPVHQLHTLPFFLTMLPKLIVFPPQPMQSSATTFTTHKG